MAVHKMSLALVVQNGVTNGSPVIRFSAKQRLSFENGSSDIDLRRFSPFQDMEMHVYTAKQKLGLCTLYRDLSI